MVPPTSKCLENPSEKDEVWDKCVRRSSIGLGLGTLVGAVSSMFFGTGGIVFSISMCATWAIKHCRALFREQEQLKKKADEWKAEICRPREPPPPPPKVCPIPEEKELPKTEEKICTKPIEETAATFPFPPVIPIPDRPFGRIEEDEYDKEDCECNIEKKTETETEIICTCPKPENINTLPNFYLERKDDIRAKGDGKQIIEEDICTCSEGAAPPTPLAASAQIVSQKDEEDICTCQSATPTPEPECECTYHSPPPADDECTCECTCP